MLDIIGLIALGACFALSFYRHGATSAITFLNFYMFMSSIALVTVNILSLTKADFIVGRTFFSAMPMEALEQYTGETVLTFLIISVFSLISQIGIPNRPTLETYQPYENDARRQAINTLNGSGSIFAFSALIVASIYHFSAMNFDTLWSNTSYLAIKTPSLIGLSEPFSIVYHTLFRVFGLASVVLIFFYKPNRHPIQFTASLLLASYAIVLLLAGNSRWVPLYFFAAAGAALAVGKPKPVTSGLASIAGIISFVAVIHGRARSEFGISQIGSNITGISLSDFRVSATGIFFNIFEGGLNFANSLRTNPDFEIRYQLLSLSPLPSFIDGFSAIRETDKYKFALHVPMGGLGEAVHFTPALALLFAVLLLLCFRLIGLSRYTKSAYVYYAINVFAMYSFYLLPTYSLRTSWRYILIAACLGLVTYLQHKSDHNRQRNRSSSRHRIVL